MENNLFDHRETHDFLNVNVESFSQLPFIRPITSHKEKGIRLFGKEFGGGETPTSIDQSYATAGSTVDDKETCRDNNGGENTRRFECQYCCRNFPTSQALGGHQNAHKRERQNAKRAHLQSAMMNAGGLADAVALPPHMYGLMNYHRHVGGAVATTQPPLTYHDHKWIKNSSAYTSSSRLMFGGGSTSYSQLPISRSPLAMWRIPVTHSSPAFDRPAGGSLMHPQPLLGNLEFKNPQVMNSTISQSTLWYDQSRPKMKDQVSLDLRL